MLFKFSCWVGPSSWRALVVSITSHKCAQTISMVYFNLCVVVDVVNASEPQVLSNHTFCSLWSSSWNFWTSFNSRLAASAAVFSWFRVRFQCILFDSDNMDLKTYLIFVDNAVFFQKLCVSCRDLFLKQENVCERCLNQTSKIHTNSCLLSFWSFCAWYLFSLVVLRTAFVFWRSDVVSACCS